VELILSNFLKRLENGETPEAILSSLRPQGHRELLKRCSVVRTFDRGLFETVLLSDVGDAPPTFDEFVQTEEVEPLPRTKDFFQLRRVERSANWRAWWEGEATESTAIPESLRRFLELLAEYYRATDNSLDLLAHLSLIDPAKAAILFQERYDAADELFDLAGCQDLIDVLTDPDRTPLLEPELIALRSDRAAYLRARSLWSAEYYQTATFLEPAGVRDLYEELVAGTGARVLDLHAPGGRGKTIQLRWLFSRQLVPEPGVRRGQPLGGGRIPCAKVDFDLVDPVNATRYAWLVLLEAAAQLNEQLPRLPFNELLERDGWAAPLLRRNAADPTRVDSASKRVRSAGEGMAEGILRRFGRTLNEAAGNVPVVLVLDTLEEVHLRPQGDLYKLLRMLSDLLQLCPGVRLILSGRYSVREVLGAAADELPSLKDAPVKLFSSQEAERYLEQLRRIEDPSIRRAMVRKANGDAFILSLLADIVQQQPSLSAADIRRYPADAVKLIRRVVDRIQEPRVRWLLRYGVVPRELSFAFVRDVMQSHLRREMSPGASLDDPEGDELPRELEGAVSAFRSDLLESPESPLDLQELWTQLRCYAGSTSWVFELPGEETAVRFRSDVVVPMRRIIRSKKVYRPLHKDAIVYFERKAREEPDRWGRWMREALYHRFQLQGAAAARSWRRTLNEAGYANPERREAVAAELLEPDYVDERGKPLPWDESKPIVTASTLIEANFELACALTELARARRVAPDDQLWSRAEQSLSAVERGEEKVGSRVIPSSALAYVRAGLALKDGRVDEAEAELVSALTSARRDVDVARLRTLLADAQLARRDPAAVASYEKALEAARHARAGAEWIAALERRLVLSLLELDRLKEGFNEYRRGLRAARAPEQRGQLLILGSQLGLRAGHVHWAEDTARLAREEADDWDAWIPRVSAALAGLEPGRALDLATEAETEALGGAPSGALDSSAPAAWSRELVGLCSGALMQFEAAVPALETARSLWKTEGDVEAVARCYARSAVLELRGVGDVRKAEHHLTEARQLSLRVDCDAWLDCRLLFVEVLERKGMPGAAIDLIHSTVQELKKANAAPRSLIRTAVTGLPFGSRDERLSLLQLLVEQCELVTPGSARIVLLSGLRSVPELPERVFQECLGKLRRLLRIGTDSRLTARDRAQLTLTLAELDRISGNHTAAMAKLTSALPGLRRGETRFFLREWALACDRVGGQSSKRRAPSKRDVEAFLNEFQACPMLCAAFLVERAEAILRNNVKAAKGWLDRAEEFIVRAPEERTQWHARLQRAQGAVGQWLTITKWAGYVGVAAAAFLALGDLLSARSADATSRDEPLSELEQTMARATVGPGTEGLQIRTTIPPAMESAPESRELRLFRLLEDWVRRPGTELSSYEFEDWCIDDLVKVGKELGALLFSPAALDAVRERESALDLRLEIEGRRLAAVPWEIARAPDSGTLLALEPWLGTIWRATSRDGARRDATRFLQLGLNRVLRAELPVDGDFGPASSQLLRDYQRQRGLEADGILRQDVLFTIQTDLASSESDRPLVILVQPSMARQFEGIRGLASLGVDMTALYDSSGFEVWRVDNPSIAEISAVIADAIARERIPAALHFSGGLRESSGEVAFTFLAGDWYSESLGGSRFSDELPVTALAHLLSAFPQDSFRPLVILDVDRPPGISETINHLLLRNAFAGGLFALGSCPAILATGLVGAAARTLYGTLVGTLGSGATVGETCREIHSLVSSFDRTSEDFESTVPLGGAALFSHLPWLRLVSP
jgi:cellulose synthase operon protein C